jgi:hypothetical protein
LFVGIRPWPVDCFPSTVAVGAVPILRRGPLLGSRHARGAIETTIRLPAEKSESKLFGHSWENNLDLTVRFLAGGFTRLDLPFASNGTAK